MIKFNKRVINPDMPVWVACSGGPDSMAVLDFLNNGKWDLRAVFFNHGDDHSDEAEEFVQAYCHGHKIPFTVGRLTEEYSSGSIEKFWRDQRYAFFTDLPGQVITAHHLGDVVEWWLFTSFRGNPRLIPWSREPNIVRPFLGTTKDDFLQRCRRRRVPFVNDPCNHKVEYMRNYIRHVVMPHALHVNPGLFTTVRNRLMKESPSEPIAVTRSDAA